jgi:hypothetical protein
LPVFFKDSVFEFEARMQFQIQIHAEKKKKIYQKLELFFLPILCEAPPRDGNPVKIVHPEKEREIQMSLVWACGSVDRYIVGSLKTG